MTKQGSYHAFLAEFNRRKSMINTGPDEVIEHFFLAFPQHCELMLTSIRTETGLDQSTKSWLNLTTERVNSAVIINAAAPRSAEQSSSKQNNKFSSHNLQTSNKFMPSAGSQQATAGRASTFSGRGRGRGRGRASNPSAQGRSLSTLLMARLTVIVINFGMASGGRWDYHDDDESPGNLQLGHTNWTARFSGQLIGISQLAGPLPFRANG